MIIPPNVGASPGARDSFLGALAPIVAADERLILCGVPGDPGKAAPTAWRPRPWSPGRGVPFGLEANGYCTVATFRRGGDGSFRRRTEAFAAGYALMVDDVGTKTPREAVCALEPSARVETSAGNEQWWYFLLEPERDVERFDAMIRAFISGRLLGADPGMSGVTRVGRLPAHTNGKPSRGAWRCRLLDLDAELRYTVEELLSGFGLRLNGRRTRHATLPTEEAVARNEGYAAVFRWLLDRGQLKRPRPDPSGWVEMHCPWRDEHSGAVDNGAALREPAPENDYYGAFRCHHGHCADRGWAELSEWVADAAAAELDSAAQAREETAP